MFWLHATRIGILEFLEESFKRLETLYKIEFDY